MKRNSTRDLMVGLCMVIGFIVLIMPTDHLSTADKSVFAVFLPPVMFAVFSLLYFREWKALTDLKNRCPVKVGAVCTGTTAIGSKDQQEEVFYKYDYNGSTYKGSIYFSVTSSHCSMNYGDNAEIYINPDCLPDDIYDPCTDNVRKRCFRIGMILLIICAVSFELLTIPALIARTGIL